MFKFWLYTYVLIIILSGCNNSNHDKHFKHTDNLNSWSYELCETDTDSSINLAELALKTSKEDRYSTGLYTAYNNLGNSFIIKKDFKKASTYIDSAINLNNDNKIVLARSHLLKSQLYLNQNENSKAQKTYDIAYKLFMEAGDYQGASITLSNSAHLYLQDDYYYIAKLRGDKALEFAQQIRDPLTLMRAHLASAYVYSELNQENLYKIHLHPVIEYFKNTQDKKVLAQIHLIKGLNFEKTNKDSAEANLLKAKDLFINTKCKRYIHKLHQHLGEHYLSRREWSKSEKYFRLNLKYTNRNYPQSIIGLCKIYSENKQYNKLSKVVNLLSNQEIKNLNYSDKFTYYNCIKILNDISGVNSDKNILELLSTIQDEEIETRRSIQIDEFNKIRKIDDKYTDNKILNQRRRNLEIQLKIRNSNRILLGSVILLTIVLMYFLYRVSKKNKLVRKDIDKKIDSQTELISNFTNSMTDDLVVINSLSLKLMKNSKYIDSELKYQLISEMSGAQDRLIETVDNLRMINISINNKGIEENDISIVIKELVDKHSASALERNIIIINNLFKPLIINTDSNKVKVLLDDIINRTIYYSVNDGNIYIDFEEKNSEVKINYILTTETNIPDSENIESDLRKRNIDMLRVLRGNITVIQNGETAKVTLTLSSNLLNA